MTTSENWEAVGSVNDNLRATAILESRPRDRFVALSDRKSWKIDEDQSKISK